MKTKTQHTPGPWKWDELQPQFLTTGNGGKWILVHDKYAPKKEDACLIATAPDLLEAAKLAAKMLLRKTLQNAEDTEAYNKLKAAIAKAEDR